MIKALTKIAGRYVPTGNSDAGGMSEVFECIDEHLERPVIIKCLQVGEETRRIVDEQRSLMTLRSKHVVQIYDIVTVKKFAGDRPGIVLEKIEGTPLSIGSYKPDLHYMKVIWQIACGLADIHSANVVHRDIKPNNILLDHDGTIKILDFGLAREVGVNSKTEGVIGTPAFMAPELWGGGKTPINFDFTADVYAFAITCIALLSRNLPNELLMRPPQAVSRGALASHFLGTPNGFLELVASCLESEASKRPSMLDVRNAIEKYLLQDRHRAYLVFNGVTHQLDSAKRSVTLTRGQQSISIDYDGFRFLVTNFSGAVFINNSVPVIGDELPKCCVLTMGAGPRRDFVTFDVSNPEVMA